MVRWNSHIQKNVNKFCGVYAQIEARNQSGATPEDKVKDAMVFYEEQQEAPFTMYPLWTILKNAPKWHEEITSGKKGKRKHETPDELMGGEPTTDAEGRLVGKIMRL